MNKTKIQKLDEACRPLLVCINKINSTLPKTKYVVYYRNPMYEEEQVYKNLDSLKEIFLPNHQMQLKIINFESQDSSIIIKNDSWSLSGSKLVVSFTFLSLTIVIEGSILNESQSNQAMVNLSFIEKKGYDDFYKFRKKYKTLQNITRKISFKIDHRLKMMINGREYKFDLQEKKKQHYFVNIDSFQSTIQIVLQQITSIQDLVQVDKIEQLEIDLRQMMTSKHSYRSKIMFTNKLELSFLFNIIKNQNYSQADFVALRLLEVSGKSSYVKIGTEDTINSSNCLKVSPLLYGKYYDYEWGYLNDNIKEFEAGANIYEYLQKLTKSSPKYAHFVNQEIIDLKMSSFVVFEVDGSKLKIPIAYILKGFNFIENDKFTLKFYVDTSELASEALSNQQKDRKRIYQLKIEDIWNFNKINIFLDKSNCNQFSIKIINEGTYYFIPFQRKYVNKQQLRKQGKQLQIKNEISSKDNNKYYSIQKNSRNKDQLTVIQSVSVCPFYIMKFMSSSSLSFQMIVDGSIAFEGSLTKQKIISNQSRKFVHLLNSVEGNYKIGMVVAFNEISQPAESAATYYNFKHRLFFAEGGQTQDITYDIQIQFEKDAKIKPLRSKLSPQMKKQLKQAIMLRQFAGDSGVFRKQQTLSFTLKIKKMFYNDKLNFFDNQILISKQIFVNPTADQLLSKAALMIKLQKECYQGLEFDLYDVNIKKRIKYYLEVYAQKNQFLDFKDSSYKIKIPSILWNFNNGFRQQQSANSYQMTVHLSRKSKNTEKVLFDGKHLQDLILNHHNYKDGFTVKRGTELAYSKFMNAVKLKCDVLKDNIGWSGQNQWFFAVMSFSTENFYCLIQRMFDPYEDKRKKSGSSRSNKTVSRQQSARSDKHKIDPLAKTVSNLDLYKLKNKKNELIAQGRQLTTRYVKRQQKLIQLAKQLSDLDEQIKKKQQQEIQNKNGKKKMKKQNTKMKQFYRSICQCGARNPQYNGYCDQCLKKLKDRYQTYVKQYKDKSYLYEKMIFLKFNQKQKIDKLQKKIERLKNQEIYGEEQQQGPQILMKDMQEKGLKKVIEDLKIDIFEIDEERASLVSTSNWQMKILEQKISKQDGKIYSLSQQYDSLKNKLTNVIKMMKKDQQ